MSVIVHSHLRWDFVWQRPQQLLSRLSRHTPVVFVEEPVFADDLVEPRLSISSPLPAVHRVVPQLPTSFRDERDKALASVRGLLAGAMQPGKALYGKCPNPIQWFYTPMPAPAMLGAFNDQLVVYDCMDELSQFDFAPTEIGDRERLLMTEADVVFTGGYKLAQAKSKHHANVHFFGCGVDVGHFAAASTPELEVAPDVRTLGPKVIGYYGVIDERLDYDLIAKLAAAMPDVAIVMVGPVVKVAVESLPKAPNIHWVGQRDYSQLPSYVKGFAVCLMPFALNAATEYINPTKTLEYMAAGKPIVSTAVADVVRNFTPVVAIGDSHDEFIRQVGRALQSPDAQLIGLGLEQAKANSWEEIVSSMEAIISDALAKRKMRSARKRKSGTSVERDNTRDNILTILAAAPIEAERTVES